MAEETVTDRKLWQSLEDIESTLLQQPFAEESYAQYHPISLDSWQSENEGRCREVPAAFFELLQKKRELKPNDGCL